MPFGDLVAKYLRERDDPFMRLAAVERKLRGESREEVSLEELASLTSAAGVLETGAMLNLAGGYMHSNGGNSLDIDSSTAENEFYRVIIPAGLFSANNFILCRQQWVVINSSGSGRTFTWRYKLGSTTITTVAATLSSQAALRLVTCWFRIRRRDDADDQRTDILFEMFRSTTPSGHEFIHVDGGTAAEDPFTDLAFVITGQMSASSVAVSMGLFTAVTLGPFEEL